MGSPGGRGVLIVRGSPQLGASQDNGRQLQNSPTVRKVTIRPRASPRLARVTFSKRTTPLPLFQTWLVVLACSRRLLFTLGSFSKAEAADKVVDNYKYNKFIIAVRQNQTISQFQQDNFVNVPTVSGYMPLVFAATLSMFRTLLEMGADPNALW